MPMGSQPEPTNLLVKLDIVSSMEKQQMTKLDDPVQVERILSESKHLIEESWQRYDDIQGVEEELRLELMEIPEWDEWNKTRALEMYSKFIQAGEKMMKRIYRMCDRHVRFAELNKLTSGVDVATRGCAESYRKQLSELI